MLRWRRTAPLLPVRGGVDPHPQRHERQRNIRISRRNICTGDSVHSGAATVPNSSFRSLIMFCWITSIRRQKKRCISCGDALLPHMCQIMGGKWAGGRQGMQESGDIFGLRQ